VLEGIENIKELGLLKPQYKQSQCTQQQQQQQKTLAANNNNRNSKNTFLTGVGSVLVRVIRLPVPKFKPI
jgi:hypothetical protein